MKSSSSVLFMLDLFKTVHDRWRLSRLVQAMVSQGMPLQHALMAIDYHSVRGTLDLLEQEWRS